MARVLGPRVGIGFDAALPIAVLGACWIPVAAAGAVWTAGNIASWISGSGWAAPPFTVASVRRFLVGGTAALWPAVPAWLVWGVPAGYVWAVTALELDLVFAPLALALLVLSGKGGRPGDPWGVLATPRDVG